MIPTARVAVFGGHDIEASIRALGLEPADDGAVVAVVDLRDPHAVRHAAALPRDVPRVVIAGETELALARAMGVDPACVVAGPEPAILGPLLMAALPAPRRAATRVVLVSALRGGVGRTLLVANLARRVAARLSVCVVDATGTGAVAWWLGCTARAWSAFEGLVDEMSPDHLSVAAELAEPRVRVVGGASITPSHGLVAAAIRAAAGLDDLVLVDAPLLVDGLTRAIRASCDRLVVIAYDDPMCCATLEATPLDESDWLIASQSKTPRVGGTKAFAALPRDESAVAGAIAGRGKVGGALGRAYDDLAELLVIDAT